MPTNLTEREFSKHLHTKFLIKLDTPEPIELELTEVKGYQGTPDEPGEMERFSLFFEGPVDAPLPQQSYPLEHNQMGAFDIFLVPVGRASSGFRYEAVFNYFKTDTST